jgi:hypothetical protein
MVNVLCIKWGTKYGADYVNKLRSMVKRHLSLEHRFICFTDDAQGIHPDVEVFDLPKVGFADFDERKPWAKAHGWLKLTSFHAPLYDITGTTLFLDLDIVIVDSLNSFFEQPGEFVVIREWDKTDGTGNTSVYRYEVGAHTDALKHLFADPQAAMADVRNEQEFITQYLQRQGKLSYWPDDWCRSFKRHCVGSVWQSWTSPPSLPAKAKIIAFHGIPNPPDAIAGRSGKWYRRVAPTAWVAQHWR